MPGRRPVPGDPMASGGLLRPGVPQPARARRRRIPDRHRSGWDERAARSLGVRVARRS